MKKPLFLCLTIAVLVLSTPLLGQPFDRILIPSIAEEPVPGAFGSQWITEISGQYEGSDRLRLFLPVCPSGLTCVYGEISSGSTFGIAALPTNSSPHGSVLTTWAAMARDTIISVRARDLSRSLSTWGTEIPVVRESETTGTPITFLNLPTTDAFRLTIRMYDFDRVQNAFIITMYPLDGDEHLGDIVVTTSPLRDTNDVSQGLHFAVLADLGLSASAPERVRVVIRPQIPTRFWAFATVTNNHTQHVTAIQPLRPAAMP